MHQFDAFLACAGWPLAEKQYLTNTKKQREKNERYYSTGDAPILLDFCNDAAVNLSMMQSEPSRGLYTIKKLI